jgi:hypothetical protein
VDVNRILASTSEPATSTGLLRWVDGVRKRLVPEQLSAMERWFNDSPFDAAAQQAFRAGRLDTAALSFYAQRLGRNKPRALRVDASSIARVFDVAHERPALASTLVWHLLGTDEPELASNLIQSIRERARLPGLRHRIEKAELPSKPELSWFDDRQLEDAAEWAEHIPAPPALTLAAATAAVEAQRATASVQIAVLVPFVQRIASFLLSLSKSSLDPLGFRLSPEAQLVVDPPLPRRVEIVRWGRTVGRTLCLRGQMMIMSIGVAAPWPLALELVTSELGRGATGALGIVMRLRGDVSLPPSAQPARVLLCLPGEPFETLGARFERWSLRAYPHAVDVWRGYA